MSSAYFNVTENRNFMKKLILMIAVMFTAITTMSAKVEKRPLEPQKFYKTMYIGFGANANGLVAPKYNGFDNFGSTIGGGLNLRIGKNVTPIFGVLTEFSFNTPNVDEHFNGPFNFIDLGMNFTLNANNIIHGFKGKPDKFEVVPFVGLGWERYLHEHDSHSSDIYSKGGLQLNLNIVENWQFNVVPYAQYRLTESTKEVAFDSPRFTVNNLRVGIEVGFTYKFGDFKYSNLKYTQAEFDVINDEINALRAVNNGLKSKNKILEDENSKLIDTNNELSKQKPTIINNIMPTIQFEIGKSDIQSSQRASLEQIATFMKGNKSVNVTILGHADAKTGTDARNAEISRERARSVKDALVSMGVESERLITFGKGSTEQPFGENDANRVVIFTETK